MNCFGIITSTLYSLILLLKIYFLPTIYIYFINFLSEIKKNSFDGKMCMICIVVVYVLIPKNEQIHTLQKLDEALPYLHLNKVAYT